MKMKFLIISILTIFIPFINISAENKYPADQLTISSAQLNANQINTWFKNNADFNNNPFTHNSGFEWPLSSGLEARYEAGIWMGCVINNDTFTSCVSYVVSDFTNGYIDDFGISRGMNDSNYRIYKIYKGDSLSSDYLNWPVNQGAYTDYLGRPYFLGKQTMFYVFNDNYTRQIGFTSDSALKTQILQTNWAYNTPGLENVIFTEYRIINRSHNTWNNFYFGIWNDDDGEYVYSGKVACDTLRDLGYNYYTVTTLQYGSNAPAIGNLFLKGLYKYTGNINDSVKYYSPPGSNNLIVKPGYKDLKMRICNRFNNSAYPSEPINNIETYRVITGHLRDGSDWVNPVTNNPTTFVNSGDPVTGTGWIQPSFAYKRTFQGIGPADVNPGDTISVIYAQLIARGSSNLNSIVKLRETADFVKQIYDENFQSVVSVQNSSIEIPDKFILNQNYPNPFNPNTTIRYLLPENTFMTIKIYDNLGRILNTLFEGKQTSGSHSIEFNAVNYPSGVYFYKLDAGKFNETKRMILLK